MVEDSQHLGRAAVGQNRGSMRNKRSMILVAAVTTAVLALLAALVGGAVVFGGLYDVASTQEHFQLTYRVLEKAMRQSVKLRTPSTKMEGVPVTPRLSPWSFSACTDAS